MKILVLLLQGRSKSNSSTDTWHSWDPEKRASGVKDMQPIMVANGIFVLQNSGHPAFRGLSPLGCGLLQKKNNRDTIHFNGKILQH